MKISPTLSDLHATKSPKRLPGETHPFVSRSSVRNLVPPQKLAADGTITSARDHEVSRGDPLLLRIRELEAEVAALRKQLESLT